MPRTHRSRLSGSGSVGPDGDDAAHPGAGLGLPASGPGSLARPGRRIAALIVDWLLAYGLAGLAVTLVGPQLLSTAVLLIWLGIGVGAVRCFGFTPGQYALGLAVVTIDQRAHVGLGRAVGRGLLISLVVPGLITDADGRGLQDRATNTAVVMR